MEQRANAGAMLLYFEGIGCPESRRTGTRSGTAERADRDIGALQAPKLGPPRLTGRQGQGTFPPSPRNCGCFAVQQEIQNRHIKQLLKYGWGARIRTWDHGTKTRCLTTWLRPNDGREGIVQTSADGRAPQLPSDPSCATPAAPAVSYQGALISALHTWFFARFSRNPLTDLPATGSPSPGIEVVRIDR